MSVHPFAIWCIAFTHYSSFQAIQGNNRCHSYSNLKVRKICKWIPPHGQLVKINFDGTKDKHGGAAGGFILRSSDEVIAMGYTFYGTCSISQAEFQACRDGLLCALRLGVQSIIIEGDSALVINSIKFNKNCGWKFHTLRNDIITLMERFRQYHVQHTYREANGSADCLTKEGSRERTKKIGFT